MSAPNLNQLRQLMAEKFPGVITQLGGSIQEQRPRWATSLPGLDAALGGGLRQGELIEIVAGKTSSGSASLLRRFLYQAAQEKKIVALVDGYDSFDASPLYGMVLARLLWIRCRSAQDALKASDILLRDQNISMVLLDLAANPLAQLRGIPATTWYRLQRLVEETSVVCIIFTPQHLIHPARLRITLNSDFSLDAIDAGEEELLQSLRFELSDTVSFQETERRTA